MVKNFNGHSIITHTHTHTLGAHQYGVPTKELAGEAMEADPKSASLTWPGSVSRTFPALISLRSARGKCTAYNNITEADARSYMCCRNVTQSPPPICNCTFIHRRVDTGSGRGLVWNKNPSAEYNNNFTETFRTRLNQMPCGTFRQDFCLTCDNNVFPKSGKGAFKCKCSSVNLSKTLTKLTA